MGLKDIFLAPTLKLIGNGMIMGVNELLAETLTFGEKSGIGQQTVYNLIKGKYWIAFYLTHDSILIDECSEIMPAPLYVYCQ
jgi:3-hydroxyisobutyrate dehydrogenase-like beta-hydroxyacid dehydrogenase